MATLCSDAHLKQTAQCCMPFVAKVVVTKLRSLRQEIDYMELYWRRSAPDTHFEADGAVLCAVCFKSLRDEAPVASWGNGLIYIGDAALKIDILKQAARHSVPSVSKVFVTKLSALRGEMGSMHVYWWRSAQHAHFETDGVALCAMCFKSLRDEAPVASWGNGLYGYILATQHSRFTFWNRRRGTACRLFQKSLWRSSRHYVERWVVWMYTGDAALNMHILKQTAWRCVPCVSKVFVTKHPSLRGEMGCMDIYWRRSTQDSHFETDGEAQRAVCFKSLCDEALGASWRDGLYGCILVTQRSICTFWNRRPGAVCHVFQKSSWRSSRRLVGRWVVWIYIGDAALKIHILKQTARHSVPSVSKVFVAKFSALRGEMGCMDVYWWRSAQHAHFETDGVALCAMCFKSLRDEAPVASWGYGGWNRRRGAVCRLFQKSSWRSSGRFVDEVTHISRSDGIVKVLKLMAILLIWAIAVCFKSAST